MTNIVVKFIYVLIECLPDYSKAYSRNPGSKNMA